MRALWISIALLSTVLAGCADGGPAPPATDDAAFDGLDGQATSTTGLIRGVVFDDTITPIEGVSVQIKALQRQATTNAEGAFLIDGLEPGVHFLEIRKIGYTPVQQSAEVVAGVQKPDIVKVRLLPNPSELPDVVSEKFDGFIQCSWVAVALAFAMCSVGEPEVDLGDEFITFVKSNGYPDFIQGELVWDSTQSLGSALSLSVYDGTLSAPKEAIGKSPQAIGQPRAFWENGTGSAKSGSPMVSPGEEFSWRVFAGGTDETRGTLIWGVGVTVEQKFEIFTHMFWNMQPEEGWQFSLHGEPVIPA